jgi:hypothetical protein
MISTWKQELMKRASELFARGNKAPTVDDPQRVIDGSSECCLPSPAAAAGGSFRSSSLTYAAS